MKWKILFFTFFAGFLAFSLRVSWAEEIDSAARIQKLEEQNNYLQEELNKQREAIELLTAEVSSMRSNSTEYVLEEKAESSGQSRWLTNIPKLNIKGFSDLSYNAKFTDKEGSSTFSLGGIDLLMTSQLSERASVLGELLYEFNTGTNAVALDFERFSFKYSFSDLLNLTIGRMHTPLGYWNQVYHHGTWIQTTASRPLVYRFEDDGGILPVHQIGVELSGTKNFETMDLKYNLAVSNGRGRTVDEVQQVEDKNNSKAVNALLSVSPRSVEGLEAGTIIYYDKIPADLTSSSRANRIDELILGGFARYERDKLELLGEFFNIRHGDKTLGRNFDTAGFYLQGGYKINKYTPYYRFDFIDFENGDPYDLRNDIDVRKHTLGLRWDMLTWSALKFEYGFSEKKRSNNEHLVTVNTSFTF